MADGRDVAKLFLAYTEALVAKPITSFGERDDYEIKLDREKGYAMLIDYKEKTSERIAKIDDNDR